jgi:hypothetical protein
VESSENVARLLEELEATLAEEHRALRALDRESLERSARQKLRLDEELRKETRDTRPRPEHSEQLLRIRRAALENQVLIVHARACVQSVLSMVTGEAFTTYPGAAPSRVAPGPLQVSVRG